MVAVFCLVKGFVVIIWKPLKIILQQTFVISGKYIHVDTSLQSIHVDLSSTLHDFQIANLMLGGHFHVYVSCSLLICLIYLISLGELIFHRSKFSFFRKRRKENLVITFIDKN